MAKDTTDKGLFSRLGGHYGGGGYGYPPSYGYTPCPYSGGYGYPPAGYPPPPQAAYPPVAYPYAAHTHHSGYGGSHMGPMLAGGAASAYGMHHLGHGGHRYGHGHHGYGHHGKFKHGKFGKHWKHGMFHGKFKKWK